jgi:hypothetical protein
MTGDALPPGAMRLVLRTHGIRGLRLRAFVKRVQRKATGTDRRLDVIRAYLLATRQIVIEGIDGNRDAPISPPCHPGQLMLPF